MSTHSSVAFDGEAIGLSKFAFGAASVLPRLGKTTP